MSKKALTDAGIRAMALPVAGRVDVPDSVCRGLYLRLSASGARTWSFRYRDRVTGKTERKTLGPFPDVSLARARVLADADRVAIHGGVSPQAQLRQARRAESSAVTFADLTDRYLADAAASQKKKPATVDFERSNLNAARAAWGGWKAKDITRQDVREFLDKRALKAPIGANRTLAILSGLFGWAVEKGLIETTPIVKLARPTKRETAKDRVLTEAEMRLLWPLFDRLDPAMAAAFRLLLLTGQRPGQVVSLENGEIRDATAGKIWQIPLAKRKDTRGTKRGPHLVPLSLQAAEAIRAALAAKSKSDESPFVFASFRNHGSPIDRHSLSRALQRLIASLPAEEGDELVAGLKADRPTPHDFRRTVATQMAALGVIREDRLAVLDHSEGDVHDVHYDRHERIREKRAALELWANHLNQMLTKAPRAQNRNAPS